MSGTMAPQTAREAWLRGQEDAVRYIEHGNPFSWQSLTGSDPTGDGYAERVFGRLARDWQAGWDHGAALCADGHKVCCCQNENHREGGSGHTYLGVRAGAQKDQDGRGEDAPPCLRSLRPHLHGRPPDSERGGNVSGKKNEITRRLKDGVISETVHRWHYGPGSPGGRTYDVLYTRYGQIRIDVSGAWSSTYRTVWMVADEVRPEAEWREHLLKTGQQPVVRRWCRIDGVEITDGGDFCSADCAREHRQADW